MRGERNAASQLSPTLDVASGSSFPVPAASRSRQKHPQQQKFFARSGTYCSVRAADVLVDSFGYQHDLSANAALQYGNMRCRRFRQSHLTPDDRAQ